MSEVRPYLKAFALVPKKLNNQICSTGFAVLRSKGTIDPQYLLNALFSNDVIDQCGRMMVGAQYPALNDSQVKKILVPLPPLPEQRHIATILTTIDGAIQRSRQAAAETERLKAGVMQELMTKGIGHTKFGEDPEVGIVPKEWDVVRFENVIEFLQYGLSYLCNDDNHGKPVLRIPNIINGLIDTNDLKYIALNNDEINKFQLLNGDLLFVRTNGQKHLLGRCAIFKNNPKGSLFASYLIRARLKSEVMLPDFILHYSKTNNYRSLVNSYASGAADGKYNINTETLRSLIIPVPPIIEQKKIVGILDIIDRKLSLQRQRTTHYEQLKQGLMNELLTGNRRVQVM
jgi:type I restriction enzyme S subunit